MSPRHERHLFPLWESLITKFNKVSLSLPGDSSSRAQYTDGNWIAIHFMAIWLLDADHKVIKLASFYVCANAFTAISNFAVLSLKVNSEHW